MKKAHFYIDFSYYAKNTSLIGLFLLITFFSQAQNSVQQVDLLIQNGANYQATNPRTALTYFENAEKAAKDNNYAKGQFEACRRMGNIYLYQLAQPDKASEYHLKAFNIYKTLYNNKKISKTELNTFLSRDIIPAYNQVLNNPNNKKKNRRASNNYQNLYTASSAYLNELASNFSSQLNQKELNEKELILEKLKLKGNLEAKEIEALALSDSLLKKELHAQNQALKLVKQQAKIALKSSESKRQKLLIYALSLGLLLVLGLIYLAYRSLKNEKKANTLLITKNEEINQQNEEISAQRDHLTQLTIELQQQKEEIESQRDNLQEMNFQITNQRNIIEQERDQSDKLLLNILPEEVAQELKMTGKTKPKYYEMASVLFTDFKGFTNVATRLSPEEIVKELDFCFLAFDEIIEKYDLEKIKTIGDAYMCAGGLPIANKTNAIDAVKAGLAMQEFMEELKAERLNSGKPIWELRLGIHTGPLIAGVIGKHKFAYDIWGDTVNLASRMESSGEVGKVNISGDTYQLVKDYFKCTYRGKVAAKNKGEVDMYFVENLF